MTRTGGWLALAGWIAISLLAGGLGGIASASAKGFYAQLEQPGWAPPSWLFAPVWTALYLLMGIAAWLVWREVGWGRGGRALGLFVVQLVLNALWTWLFFAWRRGAWSFAEIVVLAVAILATMVAFARVRVLAAALLLPYLGWVLFATALTWSLWRRNPTLL
jgi:tryptophan-rich sensory protein